ncbi:hypothetical protein VTK56DRAFT_7453 [Thermocarpiscus australiensis]
MAKPTLQSTATARLRRTFHYPSDDDDDDASSDNNAPEVLDEQEQDSLIASLTSQNATRNARFRNALYAPPALASIPFFLLLLPSLLLFLLPSPSPFSSGPSSLLLSLLGLTSLSATTWLLHTLGVTETGFAALDGAGSSSSSSSSNNNKMMNNGRGIPILTGRRSLIGRGRGRRDDGLLGGGGARGVAMTGKSPLERHLPWLNVGLAVLALLVGILETSRTSAGASAGVNPVLLGGLPGLVYGVVVGAKVMMAGVDPERELSGLKYGYKGA